MLTGAPAAFATPNTGFSVSKIVVGLVSSVGFLFPLGSGFPPFTESSVTVLPPGVEPVAEALLLNGPKLPLGVILTLKFRVAVAPRGRVLFALSKLVLVVPLKAGLITKPGILDVGVPSITKVVGAGKVPVKFSTTCT